MNEPQLDHKTRQRARKTIQVGLDCIHIQAVAEGNPGEDSRHRSWFECQ